TCQCTNGSWDCTACPATQPRIGDACNTNKGVLPFECAYGGLTCTCAEEPLPIWSCGACPATKPATNQACGNTFFTCRYDEDTCSCTGSTWACSKATCPPPEEALFADCGGNGIFTCAYPEEDQVCSCMNPGFVSSWSCSCPSIMPIPGTTCLPTG